MPSNEIASDKTGSLPGPGRLGSILWYLRAYRDPLKFLIETGKEYPEIACIRSRKRTDVIVFHPDHVQSVLLANENDMMRSFDPTIRKLLGNGLISSQGDDHKNDRKLIQPQFDHKKLLEYSRPMIEHAIAARDRWIEGRTIDVANEMTKLAFNIIVGIVFDAKAEEMDELRESFDRAVKMTSKRGHIRNSIYSRLRLSPSGEPEATIRVMDATIFRWIEEIRSGARGRSSMVANLMNIKKKDSAVAAFTDRQLRDHAVTMLLAGHETVANTLTWIWYLLDRYRDEESKLHAEIDSVLAGRTVSVDDLDDLPYSRAIFLESLRLFPPAWLLGRRPTKEWQLGTHTIPAWSYIHVSPYAVQRDARWFEDPEEFRPTRWLDPKEQSARPRYSYFPFSAGSRKCIGDSFAMMEGVIVLATLAQKWRLASVKGQSVIPSPLVTLRPKNGLMMTPHLRHTAVAAAINADSDLPSQKSHSI